MSALLDLVEVAATTEQAQDVDAFDEALAVAAAGLAEDDPYVVLLRAAARGSARALFDVAKFFCVPAGGQAPQAKRCERLLRISVDRDQTPTDDLPDGRVGLAVRPEAAARVYAGGDDAPGAIEFYLGTQYDAFTPWWHDAADPTRLRGDSRCLPANVQMAKNWYRRAAFKSHGAAAFNLFFIHTTKQDTTKEDRALATYWLDAAVNFGDPAAMATKAGKKGVTVRAFLDDKGRLGTWGAHFQDVFRRTETFLAEHADMSLDDDPNPADEAGEEDAAAPPAEDAATEGVGAAASPRKPGPLAGLRRLAGAVRRRGKKPAEEL